MRQSDSCCAVGAGRSRAGTLGALSAVLASTCCGVPLLLLAVGLGGLGLGRFLGSYHWHFIAGAIAFLSGAWFVFLREKATLRAAGSEIRHARLTPALLAVATAAVVGFGSLNVATALGFGSKAREVSQASSGSYGGLAQLVLPVEGMTCVTCEWGMEKALRRLEGIVEVKASSSEHEVLVRYDAGRASPEQIVEAIATTGYKASLPQT